MRVCCPTCDEAVDGDDLDASAGLAACASCGDVFGLPGDAARRARTAWRPLPVGEAPWLVELVWREVDIAGGQSFEIRPRRLVGLPLLGFAAIGTATWMCAQASSGKVGWLPLGVAAGSAVTWFGLTQLLQQHFVHLDGDSLRVGTRPLSPWSQRVPTSHIDGFDAGSSRGWFAKGGFWKRLGVRPIVNVITRDGRSDALRLRVESADAAELVAARLNETLAEVRRTTAYRG